MSKKELMQIASRAIALYLVFWSLGNLGNVPALVFTIWHYAAQPASAAQNYLYKYYLLQLSSHVVVTIALFVAAIWTYRCGPTIERFLSPSEKRTVKTRPVLFFVALIIPSLAWGKRIAPPVVRPVVLNGVEYSAHGDGEKGWITATEINTHKELWIAKVFRIHTHWWKGEIDNQWIYVSYLALEQDALAIKDERGRCYHLDLNTRRVKRDRCH